MKNAIAIVLYLLALGLAAWLGWHTHSLAIAMISAAFLMLITDLVEKYGLLNFILIMIGLDFLCGGD